MRTSLLVGAGGGGDALAALFAHSALTATAEQTPPVVASFSWDRYILDPRPGPRTPADFTGLRQLSPRNWEISADSALTAGISTLPLLARHTTARFVLLDPSQGVRGLHHQLAELADAISADSITLVDVGGDIVAQGREPELLSPLADSMTLASLNGLDVPAQVVIAGAGLDGELPAATVWQRCTQLADHKGELHEPDITPYLGALDEHPSEATTLLAAAALGIQGRAEIRDRGALVTVDDRSRAFYVLDPEAVLKVNGIAQQLAHTASLDEAEQVTASIRGTTELAHERRKASTTDLGEPPPELDELAERYAAYRRSAKHRGVTLLTFRHLAEAIGLHRYQPHLIRAIVGSDGHPQLAICQL